MSGARAARAAQAAATAPSTSTPLITPARSSSASNRPLFNPFGEDVQYRGANFRELAARHPVRLPDDQPGSVGEQFEHLRDGDQAVWKKWNREWLL